MRKYLIKLLKGYSSVDEAILTIKSDDFPRKNEILTEAVKRLFSTISPEDVLQRDKETGLLKLKGGLISEGEERMLKAEAKTFMTSKLWRAIKIDLRFQLQRKMFDEASITQDILWGKLLLWYNDCVKATLKKLGE